MWFYFLYPKSGWLPDRLPQGEEMKFMILRTIGKGVLAIFKAIACLLLVTFNLLLGALRLFLILFALAARIVLAFVRIATP